VFLSTNEESENEEVYCGPERIVSGIVVFVRHQWVSGTGGTAGENGCRGANCRGSGQPGRFGLL
jgi:hypothetical protein